MPSKTPKHEAYPEWTHAKFWSFIRSALRGAANKWPPKWKVLHASRSPYKGKDKRTKWIYECASCRKRWKQKEVSVDHILPAGKLNGYEDIARFVERLFVGETGLQVLCKDCHAIKTKEERSK